MLIHSVWSRHHISVMLYVWCWVGYDCTTLKLVGAAGMCLHDCVPVLDHTDACQNTSERLPRLQLLLRLRQVNVVRLVSYLSWQPYSWRRLARPSGLLPPQQPALKAQDSRIVHWQSRGRRVTQHFSTLAAIKERRTQGKIRSQAAVGFHLPSTVMTCIVFT